MTTRKQRGPRLGVIGSGPIIPFHLDALAAAGFDFEAIGSRKHSQTSAALASRYSFAHLARDWRDVLAHDVDALLIAVNTPHTPIVLAEAIKSNVPILVEKPVAPSSADLAAFLDEPGHDKIMVGYNRRHYSSVAAARAMIRDADGAATFHASIPEASWDPEMGAEKKRDFLRSNSVHILDLLNYLFGQLHLGGVTGIDDSTGVVSRVCTLTTDPTEPAKSCGTVLVSFGSPASYFIDIHTPGKSASLRPIEFFQEFAGIQIVSPTPEMPLRRFTSTPGDPFTLSPFDVEFKPGFHSQALEFFDSVSGVSTVGGRKSATLEDAARALVIAEQLLACDG